MKTKLDLERVYQALPIVLQEVIVSIEGFRLNRRRYGATFQRLLAEYKGRETATESALQVYQNLRLRMFMAEAANAPYWAQSFAEHGVELLAADIHAELRKLPILSKAEAKRHISEILHPGLSKDQFLPCHTSGTTGSGLIFGETPLAELERWANWWRYRRRLGIKLDTWCGYFGGRSLVSLAQTEPPFWRVNRPGRQLMFSAYHLSARNASTYVRELQRRRVPWLHGYPSVLALLAKFIEEQGLHLPEGLEVITVGAESLLPEQRRTIERIFRVPVFEHYGQAEAVANISNCKHQRLHVDEDYSLVEFLPLEGMPDTFRIIGTNFTNPAFPLLRYDTGDLAHRVGGSCSCGHVGRLVEEIGGRREDVIILPNGAMVGRLDHIFKDLIHVREAQVYQPTLSRIVLRIVKGQGYDEYETEQALLNEVRKRLGGELEVDIDYVSELGRTAAGKLRFVVSDVL